MQLRILILFLLTFDSCAYAQENSMIEANQAYSQAIAKVIRGREQLAFGHSISFTQTIEEKEGKPRSSKQLITMGAKGEEMRSSTETDDASQSLNWNYSVLVTPASFPENATLIGESEKNWVFAIPTRIQANVENADSQAEAEQANHAIAEALTTELIVSKNDARLLSQRIYAKTPFKPQSLVQVNDFNVRLEYALAWENGPWVVTSMTKTLAGKYAFWVSVEEFSIVRHEDFALLD